MLGNWWLVTSRTNTSTLVPPTNSMPRSFARKRSTSLVGESALPKRALTTRVPESMLKVLTRYTDTTTPGASTSQRIVDYHCEDTAAERLHVAGYGYAHVVTAHSSASEVLSAGCHIAPGPMSRAYLADFPHKGYSRPSYAAFVLVGRTLRFSVDLSDVGCGCVASFSLSGMRQNMERGTCGGDYYCDARGECGVTCSEVGIMEANRHIWTSSMHPKGWNVGSKRELGGRHSTISRKTYGPGSHCIDTNKQFQVEAIVSLDGASVLVTLSQGGKTCREFADVTAPSMKPAFQAGLTPVFSYKRAKRTPASCGHQTSKGEALLSRQCGSLVEFSNISVSVSSTIKFW